MWGAMWSWDTSAGGERGGTDQGRRDGQGAEGNGVTGDAVTPFPAAQVHLESLAFDGHQLQCNMALSAALKPHIHAGREAKLRREGRHFDG